MLKLQFTRARAVNTFFFTYACYRAPRKAHANNEKLKSTRNEHKMNGNVMRL